MRWKWYDDSVNIYNTDSSIQQLKLIYSIFIDSLKSWFNILVNLFWHFMITWDFCNSSSICFSMSIFSIQWAPVNTFLNYRSTTLKRNDEQPSHKVKTARRKRREKSTMTVSTTITTTTLLRTVCKTIINH